MLSLIKLNTFIILKNILNDLFSAPVMSYGSCCCFASDTNKIMHVAHNESSVVVGFCFVFNLQLGRDEEDEANHHKFDEFHFDVNMRACKQQQ